jgi:hypothetical protein
MRRFLVPLVLLIALAIPALAAARAGTSFRAQLHELNGSGARGMAWVTVNGDELTIRIQATGLETAGVHLRHIHGGPTAVAGGSTTEVSKCPTPRADADGDGIISVAEGVPDYGAVIVNLGNFMAPTGSIDETFTLPLNPAVLPLDRRAIVLHGMTANGVYDPSIPIVCGQLHNQP